MHPSYFPSKLKECGAKAVPLSVAAEVAPEAVVVVPYLRECCSLELRSNCGPWKFFKYIKTKQCQFIFTFSYTGLHRPLFQKILMVWGGYNSKKPQPLSSVKSNILSRVFSLAPYKRKVTSTLAEKIYSSINTTNVTGSVHKTHYCINAW